MDGGRRFALTDAGRDRGAVPIASALLADIEAHAREAFPAECCGYVTDRRVVRCTNLAASEPLVAGRSEETAFAIGGAELLAFARSFDSPRPARVVYHSHTNGRAYFSTTDQQMAATPAGPAYPVQHVVIGIAGGRIVEAAQFAWRDQAAAYVEIARWAEGAAP